MSVGLLIGIGVKAQGSGVTVGYWPLNEIKSSGYNVITPDATGVNPGIVAGSPQPALVDGKFDKALQFDGNNFVYVPIKFVVGFPPTPQPIYVSISPNLDVQKYVEVDAWINVPGFKNATYNTIVMKATHTDQACAWQNATRVLGLALRAGTPAYGEQYVEGALSGFVLTETGFNEIVTTQPVPLNEWINVEFTRTATGLHLYVNGHEQSINVLHGSQNPQGNIVNGTEYYFGHDGFATIDDVRITDLSPPVEENAFDIGPNIMIAIIAVSVIFAVAWLLRRAIQLWVIRPKA
ncbi:MAG: LamG domain-containing protein [Candidatus Bathyarchaeota archaeon]|nr:LamG domain-containing protein [Candidatus Bathyarchaeota archaeon]